MGDSGGHLTMFPTDTDAKTQEQSTPKKESPIFPREEALGSFIFTNIRCPLLRSPDGSPTAYRPPHMLGR